MLAKLMVKPGSAAGLSKRKTDDHAGLCGKAEGRNSWRSWSTSSRSFITGSTPSPSGAFCWSSRASTQKTARYWEMTPVEGKLAATNEVDEARWVPVEEAADMLTHGRDRELLGQLEPGR